MPRQNRVLPTGEIVALPVRGTLTGNRGILHDAKGQLGRARWRHKNWISCRLEFKGWKRVVMSPGSWTELFFLDEAVACAAGHRPCATCRHDDYLAFHAAFARAFGKATPAPGMDAVLHQSRVGRDGAQLRFAADIADLPFGSFVLHAGAPHLVTDRMIHPFAPDGYGAALPRPDTAEVTVLTPDAMVKVLAAGYRPALHPSAVSV